MAEATQILTAVGRLVQGHPLEPQDKIDDKTKQPVLDAQGNKIKQWFIALAFAKNDPWFANTMWPTMQQVAQRDWPQGQYNAPSFAWKFTDGDGVDKYGKPHSNKEGFAGHWVVKITSGYAFPVVGPDGATYITDAKQIKRGDYMRASVTIKGNNPSQSPGLYLNPVFAQLCGYGEPITTGPDVQAALAAAPAYQLPQGASMVPVGAPPQIGGPGNNGIPQYQPQPQMLPQQPGMQPQMPVPAGYGPAPALGANPTAQMTPAPLGGQVAPTGMPGMLPGQHPQLLQGPR